MQTDRIKVLQTIGFIVLLIMALTNFLQIRGSALTYKMNSEI